MQLLKSRAALAVLCLFTLLATSCSWAEDRPEASPFTQLLDFELGAYDGTPARWGGGPTGTVLADSSMAHGGKWSCRIERDQTAERTFSVLTANINVQKQGKFITLKGFLKTENVTDFAGLWMRLDGIEGMVEFDNMQRRNLKGTNDWAEYIITLPFNPDSDAIVFGALMSGQGKLWVDDLQLLVDGRPYDEAADLQREPTVFDTDTEFSAGSGIEISSLSEMQVRNLALLAKVWGFLKYHHPVVTAGGRHWDFELFRVLPQVLAAADAKEAAGELLAFLASLEEVPECEPCVSLPENLQSSPRLDWLADEDLLGRALSRRLQHIYTNRPAGNEQFYIGLTPQVGNPIFRHEPGYRQLEFPDAGYRLLALFRYWNIIEYWFPNRDIMDRNWDEVLEAFLPEVVQAADVGAYQLALLKIIAEVKDGHANLYSAAQFRPPVGDCRLPVVIRFIEDQPVVTALVDSLRGAATGLEVGDVIKSIDGEEVADLIRQWEPYYPASNQPHRLRTMARHLTRGPGGPVLLEVDRAGQLITLEAERSQPEDKDWRVGHTHDRPGETFQLLSPEVAYLKLSSVEIPQTASYLEQAAETKGLIIDIRNYPAQFMVFALGGRLVEKATPFVCFTHGDLSNPGAFSWSPALSLYPHSQTYDGKVVILVDESSMSQAEYTAMAFRSAPGAVVMGSTTAGADGNISGIILPGGLKTNISGIGVFYPDHSPTQRVGIIPDVEVKPTIAGIRQGRDEVVEAAIDLIEKTEKQ